MTINNDRILNFVRRDAFFRMFFLDVVLKEKMNAFGNQKRCPAFFLLLLLSLSCPNKSPFLFGRCDVFGLALHCLYSLWSWGWNAHRREVFLREISMGTSSYNVSRCFPWNCFGEMDLLLHFPLVFCATLLGKQPTAGSTWCGDAPEIMIACGAVLLVAGLLTFFIAICCCCCCVKSEWEAFHEDGG